ncbi:hypothetical protein [Roseovarius indicus]|uniref:hypothetical protein n=1 Tax=Roseovarius indicus TaxID=540747 RepID=UPI0010FDA70B|nr:hypothetical protein [Roseovarius indicus]
MADFEIAGPYDVNLIDDGKSNLAIDKTFPVGKHHFDFLDRKGCYVFARVTSAGSTPIYVGKAKEQPIIKEAFNFRNRLNVCNSLSCKRKYRRLQLWAVVQVGKGAPHKSAIDQIETTLIQMAKLENPDLINAKKTKGQNWQIKGVYNSGSGRRSKKAEHFRRMIGLD